MNHAALAALYSYHKPCVYLHHSVQYLTRTVYLHHSIQYLTKMGSWVGYVIGPVCVSMCLLAGLHVLQK